MENSRNSQDTRISEYMSFLLHRPHAGIRHGHPAVFLIYADQMVQDGYAFYLSANHI